MLLEIQWVKMKRPSGFMTGWLLLFWIGRFQNLVVSGCIIVPNCTFTVRIREANFGVTEVLRPFLTSVCT